MSAISRVTIIVENGDGSVATLTVPVAERIQLEEERERDVLYEFGRPFAPRIERLVLSMEPLRSEGTGSLYRQTIIDDRAHWPTQAMIDAFKRESTIAGGDVDRRVRRGLIAALRAL